MTVKNLYDNREFLSTLSLRRATGAAIKELVAALISIHALLAESDRKSRRSRRPPGRISIHALLAESDSRARCSPRTRRHFYPRSPCGERPNIPGEIYNPSGDFYPRSPCGERPMQIVIVIVDTLFLSTLSLRRATLKPPIKSHRQKHFYPRSPCGERRPLIFSVQPRKTISIHALLAESDTVDTLI